MGLWPPSVLYYITLLKVCFYLPRVLIYATISFFLYNIAKDRFLSIDQFIKYKPGTKDRQTDISCNIKLCAPPARYLVRTNNLSKARPVCNREIAGSSSTRGVLFSTYSRHIFSHNFRIFYTEALGVATNRPWGCLVLLPAAYWSTFWDF